LARRRVLRIGGRVDAAHDPIEETPPFGERQAVEAHQRQAPVGAGQAEELAGDGVLAQHAGFRGEAVVLLALVLEHQLGGAILVAAREQLLDRRQAAPAPGAHGEQRQGPGGQPFGGHQQAALVEVLGGSGAALEQRIALEAHEEVACAARHRQGAPQPIAGQAGVHRRRFDQITELLLPGGQSRGGPAGRPAGALVPKCLPLAGHPGDVRGPRGRRSRRERGPGPTLGHAVKARTR
jgi:hypothetical protein